MDADHFECFYRRYVESCVAAGIEPRSREYTAGIIAGWDRILQTPPRALRPTPESGAFTEQ